jgi:hypothetical protein
MFGTDPNRIGLLIFSLAISFFESKVLICLCSAYAYAVFMLTVCSWKYNK